MRPNSDLDSAQVLIEADNIAPDDIVRLADGRTWFSSGTEIYELIDGDAKSVTQFDGRVGPLELAGGGVVAAVDGTGLVSVAPDGDRTILCQDESVLRCVTDLSARADGSLVAAIGSATFGGEQWQDALVAGDRSGKLVLVSQGKASIVATDLGWPSGLCTSGDDVVVCLAFDHRIERRPADAMGRSGTPIRTNLPIYPGRVRAGTNGWWVAAPYARNRMSEMILDEPALLDEVISTLAPKDWPVPRLRSTTPYTDVLQMGQLRMLGRLKPWAPPRSYGLVMLLDADGRVLRSHHSRVDGRHHGVTGTFETEGRLLVAASGCRAVLSVMQGKRAER